ncbi:MAG: hypothetical protein A2138_08355 [Deltaproteobacteria bacterium RBG_16_71_12]|nr:MAG: hypothetical protein A2138_08355 [Deltaproteobacteria bacterium RBG_16_71_12]
MKRGSVLHLIRRLGAEEKVFLTDHAREEAAREGCTTADVFYALEHATEAVVEDVKRAKWKVYCLRSPMVAANRCHNDDAILEPGEVAYRQDVSGRTFEATVPARVCPVCGEKVIDGKLLLRKEREVAAILAREGPIDGASFRFMRTTLGLRAADLAALLDITPETISKWENGRNPVLRSAWLVVADITIENGAADGRHPLRERLAALAKGKRTRKRVRLDAA